jgi:4-hydroxybenzoyl-CoA thioesterase
MTDDSDRKFTTRIPVRFGDCDPAGIVFYPRYFEMINGLVEDWCAQALGFSFHDMHLRDGWGLPTVHLETDFLAPSELGDNLRAELRVTKMGGASLHLAIRLLGPDNAERVRAQVVLVSMDLRERRAIPMPREFSIRAKAFCSIDAAEPTN